MKKTILLNFALFCTSLIIADVPNFYIRFNLAPAGSGIITSTQASAASTPKAITLDGNGNPTDAYLMDIPAEGSDVYTKTINLPAGNYEYQVVKVDGSGEQSTAAGAWTNGRPFTVSEQKDVVFRAKFSGNYRRFLCSEQTNLYFSPYAAGTSFTKFADADENGICWLKIWGLYYNYKIDGIIYPAPSGQSIFAGDLYTASKSYFEDYYGKVKWLLAFNTNTLTLDFTQTKKLISKLSEDSVNIGAGYVSANDLASNISSTYSTISPLNLKGGTTSVSARAATSSVTGGVSASYLRDIHKIAPVNIEAKLFYKILNSSNVNVKEGNQVLSTTDDINTGAYETQWKSPSSVNATEGLTNGNYTLKVWYQTACFGDTITTSQYSASFTVDNTTTGFEGNELQANVYTSGNTLNASFTGTAKIRLYTISGQLIDQSVATENSYSKQLKQGIYLLAINDKTHKIVIH